MDFNQSWEAYKAGFGDPQGTCFEWIVVGGGGGDGAKKERGGAFEKGRGYAN